MTDSEEYGEIPIEDQLNARLVKASELYYRYGYDDALKYLDEHELPYIIDQKISNDLGLTVVNPDTGKAKIIYRGSDPGFLGGSGIVPNITDFHYDYLLMTGNEHFNPQYWRTKWLFEDAINTYDIEECIGYSKGGSHCISLGDKYGINTTTFNPAVSFNNIKETSGKGGGGSWTFGKLAYNYMFGNSKKNESSVKHKIYRVEYDPVSVGTKMITESSHPNVSVMTLKRNPEVGHSHKMGHFYNIQLR